MKPETQKYIDTIVPLLVHLKEGGFVTRNVPHAVKLNLDQFHTPFLSEPEAYSIHREPVVVYAAITPDGHVFQHADLDQLKYVVGRDRIIRLVEDATWKEPK